MTQPKTVMIKSVICFGNQSHSFVFLDNIFIRVTLTTQSSNRNTTKLEWVFGPCERPIAKDHFSFVPDNRLLYVQPSAISDRGLGPT